MLRVLRLEAVQASQLGDGVDAPRRHQRAKVMVSNCHLKEASMERGITTEKTLKTNLLITATY